MMDLISMLIQHFDRTDLWNTDISNEFGECRKKG